VRIAFTPETLRSGIHASLTPPVSRERRTSTVLSSEIDFACPRFWKGGDTGEDGIARRTASVTDWHIGATAWTARRSPLVLVRLHQGDSDRDVVRARLMDGPMVATFRAHSTISTAAARRALVERWVVHGIGGRHPRVALSRARRPRLLRRRAAHARRNPGEPPTRCHRAAQVGASRGRAGGFWRRSVTALDYGCGRSSCVTSLPKPDCASRSTGFPPTSGDGCPPVRSSSVRLIGCWGMRLNASWLLESLMQLGPNGTKCAILTVKNAVPAQIRDVMRDGTVSPAL
jgi:hypothetical protein